jgi:hypothetical protein
MILKIMLIILNCCFSSIHTLQCYSCKNCNFYPLFSSNKTEIHVCNGTLLGLIYDYYAYIIIIKLFIKALSGSIPTCKVTIYTLLIRIQ